jgi:hypothetical protein
MAVYRLSLPAVNRSLCAGIIVCLAMAGCTSRVLMNPEYKSCRFKDKDLRIAVEGTTIIDYQGNMDNEFPRERRTQKIEAFICSTAAQTIKECSNFRSVNVAPIVCGSFHSRTIDWKNSSGEFVADVPDDTCYLSSDSLTVWLFIEQPLITSKFRVAVIRSIPPAVVIPYKPLTISARFLYWDPFRKKPVAWGDASGVYETGVAVIMTHWVSAAHDCVLQMIHGAPFWRPGPVKWNSEISPKPIQYQR